MFLRSINDSDLLDFNAKDWQLKALHYNPNYVYWGNNEDYMSSGSGWSEPLNISSYSDFSFELDELNELVNFYFFIYKDTKQCPDCELGYSKEYEEERSIYYNRPFYELCPKQKRILVENGRVFVEKQKFYKKNNKWFLNSVEIKEPSYLWNDSWAFYPEYKNIKSSKAKKIATFFGDAIDSHLIIKAALADGVDHVCNTCNGKSKLAISDCKLGLQLWFLHPRKGCSRGVKIELILEDDLPKAISFLKKAKERNNERFSKL